MEFNLLTCFIVGILLGMFIVLVAYFLTRLQERFMGLMDKAIADTVKDNKDFKKSNLKELASRKRQVGGNHYKNFKNQPVDYIMQNDLTFFRRKCY